MLPKPARLRRSADFTTVVRKGARAGRRNLVVHALVAAEEPSAATVRVGFVVSKAVGNAVVRHRVSRKLRHIVAGRLGTLEHSAALVVRALPPAAAATSAELGRDLDKALRRLGIISEPVTSPETRDEP